MIRGGRLGVEFDRVVEEWAAVEDAHDRIHPDRDDCGGVGGCTMMRAGHDAEKKIMDALEEWRERRAVT